MKGQSMAGLDSHGQTPDTSESAGTIARNAYYGLILFALYLLLYGGFIYVTAFKFEWMSMNVLGANLAIVYGMALILAALALAAVYMFLCRADVEEKGAP
jgi:uncharacterized membrane protein (DUF485 family)